MGEIQAGGKPRYREYERLATWLHIKSRFVRDWLPVLFSGLLLGVTIFYTWYASRQWQVMRDALQEARTTREIENRAYIGIKSVGLVDDLKANTSNTILVVLSNAGKTPAVMSLHFVSGIGTAPWEKVYEEPTNIRGNFTLTPGTEHNSEVPVSAYTNLELTPVLERHAQLYLQGVIEYDDVFGKHHRNEICAVNIPNTKNFRACCCTTHNSAN